MFQLPNVPNLQLIEGHYSVPLIVLSFFIAFCASYTALYINLRIKGKGFFHRNVWLALASLAMGLGIWSMHFIGMYAYQLPLPMEHRTGLTIVSIVPAIIASFIAFHFANNEKRSVVQYIISGVVMGLGISFMHYLGMTAMNIDGHFAYKPVLFTLSIVIAIAASLAAMYLFSLSTMIMNKFYMKLGASLLMAVAVTSMHYTGMLAIQVYVIGDLPAHHHEHGANIGYIATFVTIGIICLFTLSFLASRLDKYVNYRVKNFDALTALPNQNQFTEDMKAVKTSKLLAIVHIHNLEKYISAFGYTFGDAIILNVQSLLQSLLPAGTTIYRTEANRFTILPTNEQDLVQLNVAFEQICAALMRQLVVEEKLIGIEMVIAVSSTEQPSSIHTHFSNTIAVLQSNTTEFHHEVVQYDPKVHTFNFERQLVNDIEKAMAHDELFIVYQPKINPSTDYLAGLEALIRWQHPTYGFISPGVFIPVLENANKIAAVTDWIIEKVCAQINEWNENNIPFQQVSINIPGVYVTSPHLAQVLNENILKYRIAPEQLELEITETSVIHDIRNAIEAVRQFRSKGLSVALDDFGTGLSSLSYLKEIPISTIKIDKSFVDGVPHSKKDAAILNAIVILSYSLGLHVVVEGVESEEQIHYIRTMNPIPIVQGYYYSKPLTKEEFENWLDQQVLVAH